MAAVAVTTMTNMQSWPADLVWESMRLKCYIHARGLTSYFINNVFLCCATVIHKNTIRTDIAQIKVSVLNNNVKSLCTIQTF